MSGQVGGWMDGWISRVGTEMEKQVQMDGCGRWTDRGVGVGGWIRGIGGQMGRQMGVAQ